MWGARGFRRVVLQPPATLRVELSIPRRLLKLPTADVRVLPACPTYTAPSATETRGRAGDARPSTHPLLAGVKISVGRISSSEGHEIRRKRRVRRAETIESVDIDTKRPSSDALARPSSGRVECRLRRADCTREPAVAISRRRWSVAALGVAADVGERRLQRADTCESIDIDVGPSYYRRRVCCRRRAIGTSRPATSVGERRLRRADVHESIDIDVGHNRRSLAMFTAVKERRLRRADTCKSVDIDAGPNCHGRRRPAIGAFGAGTSVGERRLRRAGTRESIDIDTRPTAAVLVHVFERRKASPAAG